MKINQFAFKPTNHTTVLNELIRINFIENTDLKTYSVNQLLQHLLNKCWPTTSTQSSLDYKLNNILADTQLSVLEWLQKDEPLTNEIFYRIALQLLHFLPNVDFDVINPLMSVKKLNLTTITSSTFDKNILLDAWYRLLNTHNKHGQTFIDDLASQGYYQKIANLPKPLFFNGKSQAVFNTTTLLREVVYIETDYDTDKDGLADLIKAEIIRPLESNDQQVPILYTSSPYNQGTNDFEGERLTHNVDVELTHKAATTDNYRDIHHVSNLKVAQKRVPVGTTFNATESFTRERNYTLNDYFLARGFAVVYSAGIGSSESEGLQTTGDEYEVAAATAVVEWLHGDRPAFVDHTTNIRIEAFWSNGKIAMTGRSYLGTLATAVATTGVAGLETIVSEAAISSWYDYYRSNGLVVAPGGFPGEDADVLAEETFSRRKNLADFNRIKSLYETYLTTMNYDQDRNTGNYNQFWDARNYLKNVKNIKADILMVHGLNDWNVKPEQVNNLYHALNKNNINNKLILHQGQHIYINAMRSIDFTDMLNLWFSYKLYNLANDADKILPNVIIQDNVTPETWHSLNDWDIQTKTTKLFLNQHKLTKVSAATKNLVSFNDHLEPTIFAQYTKNISKWENDLKLKTSPLITNRLHFLTENLTHPITINGRTKLHLKIASSHNVGLISVQLVDYGMAYRLNEKPTFLGVPIESGVHWRSDALNEFTLNSHLTPFKLITKGHINLQNRSNAWHVDSLAANQFVDLDFYLQPTYFKIPVGHQLGLIIYATDFGMTIRGNQDITYTLAESDSYLELKI
ncbi:X-Pro dipeptidyl-peptidase [Weissella beninensis]|uniref:Xaa-Pro dipeptidyl-peptidase n=1 Tax=Periweissella beninensis TaxID=504936 RepID=A0ABT0VJ74_9LACO|nr:Xaa-Pro dipeptidyl-peptidase [Periweissella beninensis]MBM7544427.1 X-Pro dipeptidyl-peptidase [Periweissella beninensis]MCM2437886.1 Xaa-Pro dipeptidyl-peptidase [Periweissella beninensis]